MYVYLRAKFEVSKIILMSFRPRVGGGEVILTQKLMTKNSVMKIENLVVNHESRPVKLNPLLFSKNYTSRCSNFFDQLDMFLMITFVNDCMKIMKICCKSL